MSHENIAEIAASHEADPDPHAGEIHAHVVPLWFLSTIFVALLFLTWVTVAAINVDLGAANIWIAVGIAAVKAILVAMYFMHLRWDDPFNSVILIGSIVFLALMLGFLLMDSLEYKINYEPPSETRTQAG